MKKLTNQTIFKCEYCSKISKSGGGIRLHEVTCKKNPNNNTPCASCSYFKKKIKYFVDKSEDEDFEVGDEIYPSKNLKYSPEEGFDLRYHKEIYYTCGYDNKSMYHNKVNRFSKKIKEQIISRCDKQMPLECKYYKPDYE